MTLEQQHRIDELLRQLDKLERELAHCRDVTSQLADQCARLRTMLRYA